MGGKPQSRPLIGAYADEIADGEWLLLLYSPAVTRALAHVDPQCKEHAPFLPSWQARIGLEE